ncbi:SAM-dependent methyltransferase [Planomonospora sp. ID67723]|uniref:SAM-dependent methyltransferase n=1 Tax=Planomonospora sp. ID67723 TaxID=2738134 RepID=UPI0018C42E09|nr:SAM-dependent methyltransferase [Planomonospora sp. ID67723]MBG0830351.1 SAM-dependent methyltransferase [Planomonospora sp. ID67723]
MPPPRPERAKFDTTVPNEGRIADYFLGGKDNFAADRAAAEHVLSIAPELPALAREGRRFLARTVRFLAAEAGVRQFVDIGCGLPTQGTVHEIVHSAAPGARVVYVDNDPMVVTHGQALLQDDRLTAVVEADALDPARMLAHPRLSEMIDLERPVAILLFALLHNFPDDDLVAQMITHLRKAVAPGSYLAFSHAVSDLCPETTARLAAVYQAQGSIAGPPRGNLRTKGEVERLFDGLDFVEPGIVYIPRWRPDGAVLHGPDSVWVVGGVGRTTR